MDGANLLSRLAARHRFSWLRRTFTCAQEQRPRERQRERLQIKKRRACVHRQCIHSSIHLRPSRFECCCYCGEDPLFDLFLRRAKRLPLRLSAAPKGVQHYKSRNTTGNNTDVSRGVHARLNSQRIFYHQLIAI
jgi:hypothetical protein